LLLRKKQVDISVFQKAVSLILHVLEACLRELSLRVYYQTDHYI